MTKQTQEAVEAAVVVEAVKAPATEVFSNNETEVVDNTEVEEAPAAPAQSVETDLGNGTVMVSYS